MNIALILAGGQGSRMNHALPKQYLPLAGKPILAHTLSVFETCPGIDRICLTFEEHYRSDIEQLLAAYNFTKVRYFALPGPTRRHSSKNALDAVAKDCAPEDIILIHDAVRPFVDHRILRENIQAARAHGAVYTVFPSQDTVVESLDGATLHQIPPRQTLYLGQTPQSFRFEIIQKAHAAYEALDQRPPVTDDCSLVTLLGLPVFLVQGSKQNLKITTPEDLSVATLYACQDKEPLE